METFNAILVAVILIVILGTVTVVCSLLVSTFGSVHKIV